MAGPAHQALPSAGAVSQAQLEHLKSLGYLGGVGDAPQAPPPAAPGDVTSPQGERNLAAIHFEAGRYREAAEAYRRLVAADPENPSLRASFAGALGALERYDQALAELTRAIELEPLNVEAYHNRAVILERRGEAEKAIADYRTAVRYNPQYEPSQRALVRLTGSADVRAPQSEAEARAAQLVEQASEAARKTNYPQAMRLLDEAEKAAPEYVLTHQYRSNVAYLMGDVEGGIAALKRALELEPDNALFRANLERLRAQAAGEK